MNLKCMNVHVHGWNLYPGFPLKSQDKNSGLFRIWDTKYQPPIFVPFRALTYEFDSRTRHCETKKCNAFFVSSSNNYCSSLNEHQSWQTVQLMCWPHWFFTTIVIKYEHFFRTNAQFHNFSGPGFSFLIFRTLEVFSGPMGTLYTPTYLISAQNPKGWVGFKFLKWYLHDFTTKLNFFRRPRLPPACSYTVSYASVELLWSPQFA